jgi:rubrerythrin
MDLSKFDLRDLLLAAIKSEADSKEIYSRMAKKTKNGLLKDKLEFLSKEEEKHKIFIEEIYKDNFPESKIFLPKKSPVPLPELKYSETVALSVLLSEAMNAEKTAGEFYKSLASRFKKGTKIYNTLIYFSDMEVGHYKILENEKISMEQFEEGDVYWPMVHVGP